MRYLLSFCLAICLLAASPLLSQDTINFQMPTSINLDGSPPDGSAILDVNAMDRGLLVPRLTTSQRTAIPLPANGLLVFDTDTGSFWYYENTAWNELVQSTVSSEGGTNPTGIPIPDNDPTGIISVITLTDPDTVASDTRFRVCVDITHSWTGDLKISLEAPDGTSIDLSSPEGNFASNYTGTCFTTEATSPITALSTSPFAGNWQPEEPFSNFVGRTIAGDWKLKVVDDDDIGNNNGGVLNYWSLQLSPSSATTTLLADADGDTRVTVEDLPDEDVVRLEAGRGVARLEVRPDSAVFSGKLRVLGNFVSGDGFNTASNFNSFVGGGESNTAGGIGSFVGGGLNNTVSASDSFVGGGVDNTALAFDSFVGGGAFNTAGGIRSFVGGGVGNTVASRSQATFGEFSKNLGGNANNWVLEDPLFVIGNGTSSARSNAVTVLKNGNVGIGPEAPQNKLHVETDFRIGTGTASLVVIADKAPAVPVGGSNQASVFTTAGTGSSAFHIGIEIPSNDPDDGFYIATDANSDGTVDKLALKVRADGKVGIGTATPAQLLTISDASEPVFRFERTAGANFDYEAYTTSGGKLIFRGGADGTGAALTDFVTFDQLGKVGISTATPSADLHIKQSSETSPSAGGLRLERPSSIDNWKTYIDGALDYNFSFNGVLKSYINDTDGTYNVSSDRRLKKNIEPFPSVLSQLLQLKPVRYHFKDVEETTPKSFGFIAQEVQPLFPDVVGEKNGYLSMNYGALGIIAIQAIQEQQAIIEKQQSEIESLQSQLSEMEDLKARMAGLEAALSNLARQNTGDQD